MLQHRDTATTMLAGLQWLSFLFVNIVVIPLSIGEAYNMTTLEISGNMARSFILTGAASLIQALFGHRLPLMEGQTGLWWGVILSMANIGLASGLSLAEVGGSLSVGIMLGGAAVILFGLFGFHKLLNQLFTPIVMAVLLMLLAAQLINIFFAAMLGITSTGTVQVPTALLSVFLVVLVSFLTIAGRGLLSNFSILIGIVTGWILHVIFFGDEGDQSEYSAQQMDDFLYKTTLSTPEQKKYKVSAINIFSQECKDKIFSGGDPSTKEAELVQLTGGVAIDICDKIYSGLF